MFRLVIGALVGLALGFGLITMLAKQSNANIETHVDPTLPS